MTTYQALSTDYTQQSIIVSPARDLSIKKAYTPKQPKFIKNEFVINNIKFY